MPRAEGAGRAQGRGVARESRRQLHVPWTTTRAYVVFDHAETDAKGRVELVFAVKNSTKFSQARIKALPMEQAKRLHLALEMLLP